MPPAPACTVHRPAFATRLRRCPRRGFTAPVLPSCPLAIPSDQPDARKRCVPTVHLSAARGRSALRADPLPRFLPGWSSVATANRRQHHRNLPKPSGEMPTCSCYRVTWCCLALPPAVATRPAPDALKRLDGVYDTWPFTHPGQLPGNSCCALLVTAARTVSVFRTRRRESLAWPARRLSPIPKHVHLRRGVSGFVNAPSAEAEGTCAGASET